MREMSISHKLHPARQQGKTLAGLHVVKYALARGKKLLIGTSDVEVCYHRIRQLYPDAKLTKMKDGVLVENAE